MKNLELSIETIQLQLSAIKINTDCGQYAIALYQASKLISLSKKLSKELQSVYYQSEIERAGRGT